MNIEHVAPTKFIRKLVAASRSACVVKVGPVEVGAVVAGTVATGVATVAADVVSLEADAAAVADAIGVSVVSWRVVAVADSSASIIVCGDDTAASVETCSLIVEVDARDVLTGMELDSA